MTSSLCCFFVNITRTSSNLTIPNNTNVRLQLIQPSISPCVVRGCKVCCRLQPLLSAVSASSRSVHNSRKRDHRTISNQQHQSESIGLIFSRATNNRRCTPSNKTSPVSSKQPSPQSYINSSTAAQSTRPIALSSIDI
jgi:hypothetical protein